MDCVIRSWRLDDAAYLVEIINNRKIQDNLRDGLPFPYTEQDARDFIGCMLNADANTTFSYAITLNDRVIGSVGIFRQVNIHSRTAELGYYIGEQFWNKGYATSAVRQACNLVFANTDIIRIYAEPFSRNTASCKVLEKSGFICEGTLRANAVKNGIIEDMKIYSLLK